MFRTTFNIPLSPFTINHSAKLVSIGCCFADVIGAKLEESKFEVVKNPFGIIYNPVSILKSFQLLLNHTPLPNDSFLENEGVWYNYHLHSQINGRSKEELFTTIKNITATTSKFLSQTQLIIITLGTAFVYKQKTTNEIVANCHKAPAVNFTKELLSLNEIKTSLTQLVDLLKTVNPEVNILFTVSPVRHIKDTISLNNVSKSLLRVACHEVCQKYSNAFYFPAFEIMMDDLRDYRFYKEDMIHPTALAENYIWEKFLEAFTDETTRKYIQQWEKLRKALEHKPFQPQSEAYKKFIKETTAQLKQLGQYINLTKEIDSLQQKLE
jgi:hypothetical protein